MIAGPSVREWQRIRGHVARHFNAVGKIAARGEIQPFVILPGPACWIPGQKGVAAAVEGEGRRTIRDQSFIGRYLDRGGEALRLGLRTCAAIRAAEAKNGDASHHRDDGKDDKHLHEREPGFSGRTHSNGVPS